MKPFALQGVAALHPHHFPDLVRIGTDNDGGYVLPARLLKSTLLIGMGINTDWCFESEFSKRGHVRRLVAIDGTVSPREFLRGASSSLRSAASRLSTGHFSVAAQHVRDALLMTRITGQFIAFFAPSKHTFVKKMVGSEDGAECVSWPTVVNQWVVGQSPCSVMLKVDIEGAEFDLLPDVVADADRLAGIVVEFHDLHKNWHRFIDVLGQLSREFAVAHIHGNNWAGLIDQSETPRVLEITFVNRALMSEEERLSRSRHEYPIHGLDMPNRRGIVDYRIRF